MSDFHGGVPMDVINATHFGEVSDKVTFEPHAISCTVDHFGARCPGLAGITSEDDPEVQHEPTVEQ